MPKQTLPIAAVLLGLILAFMGGRIVESRTRALPPTVLRPDTRPTVPVISITSADRESIAGSIRGDVRLFVGEEQAIPGEDGSFRVSAGDLLRSIAAASDVPEGMRFVASKRGSKYYPVGSSAAKNLSAANRLFFATADEAEAAGYEQGSSR